MCIIIYLYILLAKYPGISPVGSFFYGKSYIVHTFYVCILVLVDLMQFTDRSALAYLDL